MLSIANSIAVVTAALRPVGTVATEARCRQRPCPVDSNPSQKYDVIVVDYFNVIN